MPEPELTDWVREMAEREDRSVSAMVRVLLKLARRQLEAGIPLVDGRADA
jgi:hypothetical protein